ncbi:MAG: YbcC family protein [Methylococcus sp.]
MAVVTPLFKQAHSGQTQWTHTTWREPGRLPRAHLEQAINEASRRIAPLWPLRHFVAVNPFLGLTDQDFRTVSELINRVGHGNLLMPASFYARQLAEGRITDADLIHAVEFLDPADAGSRTPAMLRERLSHLCAAETAGTRAETGTRLHTLSDHLDATTGSQWANFISDEISKWCAAWFDEGQSAWRMPWRSLPLYNAWKRAAQFDRTPEITGLSGFRNLVATLPEQPLEAIAFILDKLDPPPGILTDLLHRQLLSVAGWASWIRYGEREAAQRGESVDRLTHLLAIRLAYDYALTQGPLTSRGLRDWRLDLIMDQAVWRREQERLDHLNLLHLAYELHGQSELAARLAGATRGDTAQPRPASRRTAQAVFCIDVRSEIFRRAMETSSPEVETLGFAGFFGFPIEYIPLGHHHGSAQCPVLIKPRHRIRETVADADVAELHGILQRRWLHKRLNRLWKSFKTSAVSCFSYVEIAGLLFGIKLVTDSLGLTRPVARPGAAGLDPDVARRVRPLVSRQRGRLQARSPVVETGIPLKDRIDLAANALRGMSLTGDFARVVLLCGHGSSTVNNPYGSGLDCGACGGHSGEANARIAAMVLNDREVRAGLWSRGIIIPDDTWFVAGLHDTTTDRVTLFDLDQAPAHASRDLARLQAWLSRAGQLTRQERAGSLGLGGLNPDTLTEAVAARGHDWSEVRPEWGLAGNAFFIAAPRHRTRGIGLEGRAFLHEYDHRQDPDGAILSLIMTAPMVVASWINLQYYGSTVDNRLFGSGNKVLHNVVGTFGVLEGNGGDLRVGLPWQSVHDGQEYRHEPRRLTVLIEAPAAAIEQVLKDQPEVRQLVEHHWLHLLRIDPDDGRCHRYQAVGHWQTLSTD